MMMLMICTLNIQMVIFMCAKDLLIFDFSVYFSIICKNGATLLKYAFQFLVIGKH